MPVTGRRELRRGKRFHCPTIDEDVLIALRRKLGAAEANERPCPLGPHLFAAEILARKARRALAG